MKSIRTLLAALFLTGILGLNAAPVMADEDSVDDIHQMDDLFGYDQE